MQRPQRRVELVARRREHVGEEDDELREVAHRDLAAVARAVQQHERAEHRRPVGGARCGRSGARRSGRAAADGRCIHGCASRKPLSTKNSTTAIRSSPIARSSRSVRPGPGSSRPCTSTRAGRRRPARRGREDHPVHADGGEKSERTSYCQGMSRPEELLKRLAGPDASLPRAPARGDHGSRRGPGARAVRAAHRLGQVRGLLPRHLAAARAGRRPGADRLAAAGADAQPDRRRREARHPRAHDQLDQPRRLGRGQAAARRRRRRPAADQPRAPQQPAVPQLDAAAVRRARRAAGGRRGALHLRLGPRLPARLPAPAGDDRAAPGGRRRALHHRDGQRPRRRRRRRAAEARPRGRAEDLPRPARAQVAAAGGRRPARPGGPARLARHPPPAAPRQRHRLHAHQARRRHRRRVAQRPRHPRRGLQRRGRDRAAHRASRSACSTTTSRPSSPPARSAWATTSPTSASSCTTRRPARSSPTTSRSAAPGARSTARTSCCCAAARTAGSRTSSSSRPSRRRIAWIACWRRSRTARRRTS